MAGAGVSRSDRIIDNDMSPPRRKPPSDQPAKAGKGERAFDAWLKQGLHKLYDDVAGEPLPEALLKMIEEDSKK